MGHPRQLSTLPRCVEEELMNSVGCKASGVPQIRVPKLDAILETGDTTTHSLGVYLAILGPEKSKRRCGRCRAQGGTHGKGEGTFRRSNAVQD